MGAGSDFTSWRFVSLGYLEGEERYDEAGKLEDERGASETHGRERTRSNEPRGEKSDCPSSYIEGIDGVRLSAKRLQTKEPIFE